MAGRNVSGILLKLADHVHVPEFIPIKRYAAIGIDIPVCQPVGLEYSITAVTCDSP